MLTATACQTGVITPKWHLCDVAFFSFWEQIPSSEVTGACGVGDVPDLGFSAQVHEADLEKEKRHFRSQIKLLAKENRSLLEDSAENKAQCM